MQKNFTQLIAHFLSAKRYTVPAGALLLFLASSLYVWAAVGITISGDASYDVSADNAATGTFTSITDIVVSEGSASSDYADFASRNSYSIVLRAPAGWAFPTANSNPDIAATLGDGGEITLTSTPVFSTDGSTLTFNLSGGQGSQNKRDIVTISNLRIKPTTGVISSPQPREINVEVLNTTNSTPTSVTSSSPISLRLIPGAPNDLAFVQQPTTVEINAAISPSPSVVIQDRFGNTVTTATNTVAIAIGPNPPAAGVLTLGTATTSNGVVTFSGASINTAGEGYTLVASSSGLTSATSTAFTVNNPQPVITEVSGCLSVGDPETTVTITGENFLSGATVTFGGVSASSVTVNNATTITAVLPSAAFATSGNKNVIVTNPLPASSNGASAPFGKAVIALFSREIQGPNSICASTENSGAFTVETGPNIDSYLWTIKSGNAEIVSGGTTGNPRINFGEPGEVVLSVVSYNVCLKPSPEVTRTITVNARPDVVLTASSTAICAGESVELFAEGAESYVWSGGGLPTETTGERIDVAPTTSTTYTVVGTITYTVDGVTTSCPTTKTIRIEVTPALSQGAITGNTQYCQNEATTTLTGTVSGGVAERIYFWEQSASQEGPWEPAGETNNAASYNPSTADAGVMYYRRTVTSGNCTVTSDPIAVTVTPAIVNNTINTADQNICSGEDIALLDGAAATAGDLQVEYFWEQRTAGTTTWENADGANTDEDYQPATRTVTSSSTIEYRRRVEADNCVSFTDVVSVTVNPLPIATITQGRVTYFCSPGTALLSAEEEVGTYSYDWFRIIDSDNVELVAETRTANVGVEGTYYVVVTNDNTGCVNESATISVQETVVNNNIIGVENGNQEVCYGALPQEIVGEEAEARVGTLTYQWLVSDDNTTFEPLTGATGVSLTRAQLGAHTADRWYRRMAIVGSCTNLSPQTVHISVKPELLLTPGTTTPDAICSGETFSYTPTSNAPANSTYSWSRADVAGISNPEASGTGTISEVLTNTSPNPLEVTYVYQITTEEDCESALQYVTVVVNPRPVLSNTDTEVAVCSNAPFTYTATTATRSLPAPTFAWSRAAVTGISNAAASGETATVSETLVNETSAPINVTYVYRVTAYGCEGPEQNVVVTVNPTPTVNTIANATYCNGAPGAGIAFSGSVSDATYTWSSTANVGFGLNGTGNIDAFTAINTGDAPVTATVTVTAEANGCEGPAQTFTITVDPTPTVNAIANATYCNGAPGAAIAFSGSVSDATYTWSSTANVGFGLNGTGNIDAFTAINTGNAPVTATVTVTAEANDCEGPAQTFTITVNPTPTVNAIANATYCNGADGAAISFGGPVSGTEYTWTSSADVGFGTEGEGDIPAYTATNTTAAAIEATVTVTPSTADCPGTPQTFTVTVNPNQAVSFTGEIADNSVFYTGQESVTLTAEPTGGTFSGAGVSGSTFNPCDAGAGQHTITYTRGTGSCTSTVSKTVTVMQSTYRAVITANPHPFCRGGGGTDYTSAVYRDVQPGEIIYPYLVDADGVPVDEDGNAIPKGAESYPVPNPDYPYPAGTPESIKAMAFRFFQPVVSDALAARKIDQSLFNYQWGKNDEVNRKNDDWQTSDAGLSSQDYYEVEVTSNRLCAPVSLESNRMYSAVLESYTVTLSANPNPICQGAAVTFTATLGAAFPWNVANLQLDFVLERGNVVLNPTSFTYTGSNTITFTTDAAAAGGFVNGDKVSARFSSNIESYLPSSNCIEGPSSSPVTIQVNDIITATPALKNPVVCVGDTEIFTAPVTTTGPATVTYTWTVGVAPDVRTIETETAELTIVTDGTFTPDVAYPVSVVVDNNGCEVTDAIALGSITVNAPPIISAQPSAVTVCEGDGSNATFTVTATGSGIGYQWMKDGIDIPSEIGSTLTITTPTEEDEATYSVRVTGTTACDNITSEGALLTVNQPIVASAEPAGTYCQGENITLSVEATGTGVDGGDVTYEWFRDGASIGNNSSTLGLQNAQPEQTGVYTVEVTGACNQQTVSLGTLTVNQLLTITAELVSDPDTIMIDEAATFTVNTDIAEGVEVLYQWYIGDESTGDWILEETHTVSSPTDVLTIDQVEEGDFDVVVVITPRNDGTNCYIPYELVTGDITPLPVEIIYLTASKQGNNVLLEWATASETDNKGFEVQVSEDGLDYRLLEFVPSKNGNSNTKQVYAFTDKENGKDGTRYYRLKQIDHAGTFEFFGPKMVTFGSVASKVIAFPNPFNDEITLDISSETDGEMLVVITDAVGKQLIERKVQVEKGFTTEKMKFGAGLPRGLYIIRTQIGGFTQFIKMVKE
ncbi:T9SS C-terminal target domain-containing protein [Pontibacter diazotrophicus]|uniref:T9SS C-terminal target domain-containing protein n=1 Tax=Pontibacter diazotrophicus TaxID=1400979 RepID=A0A3D8L6S8_9BACT|nr:PKD-like domain-containing protein [Pontibacter diazotrophicus]RDV13120.1 T9SS C-terminal target domain-containing protein [Pontibacter diazotrophicus]